MITATGRDKLVSHLQSIIKQGEYFIGNTGHIVPIFKTERDGDTITFFLYLADDVEGNITKFQLIDQDGEVFDDQPDDIQKLKINGLLIAFKYTLSKVMT